MLTNISTKQEILEFFDKWLQKEYFVIDEDDALLNKLILASADDLVSEDVDYWANTSVKTLYQQAKQRLLGE